jgi:ornithine cyclodeaminase
VPEFTVLEKPQIQRFLPEPSEIIAALETGYISYENGQSIIPEVGYLPLEKGEVHIKYGRIQDEEIAVVKIASGYYGPKLANQSSSFSCNLLLNSTTGQPVGILNDEGLLTDIRTAIATIVASKRIYKKGDIYGVVGGGGQAYYQSVYAKEYLGLSNINIFVRRDEQFNTLKSKLAEHGIELTRMSTLEALCNTCDIITTVTPAKEPLICSSWLKPRVHINAVGSDSPNKRELAEDVIMGADLIIADSLQQCFDHGELQYYEATDLNEKVISLGQWLQTPATENHGRTICDFTGVAICDIQISKLVWLSYLASL